MDISDKLAQLNRERFDRWSLPFNSSNAKQAILAFDGGVYSGLRANTFSDKDFGFAQDHLRILSGLYGILKPLDLIQPYRLEMGVSFQNPKGKNLYDFWKQSITDNLNDTLEKHPSPVIVNCASIEYFSAIDLSIENSINKLSHTIFYDKIMTNRKYYYLFRFLNDSGVY